MQQVMFVHRCLAFEFIVIFLFRSLLLKYEPPFSSISYSRRLSPGQKPIKVLSVKKEEDSITHVHSDQLEVNSIKQEKVHSDTSIESIEYKEQLIDRLYHDAKPAQNTSYDKGHISIADYKFELDNIFLTIKSYYDDIAKLEADILHINVYTTANDNKIYDFNLSIKTGLNDVHAKLDQ